jgi:3-hydroxypropanoate dehydrogenase
MSNSFLESIFDQARTHHAWLDKAVDNEMLEKIYAHMKWGATSANGLPLRVTFVKTAEAKEKLCSALIEPNIPQTKSAPVSAIFAYDLAFYEHLPRLYPATDARSWFAGNDEAIKKTAVVNASLQAGYFMLAARALGLDCGPMAGFDASKVDHLFFSQKPSYRSFIVCNLGYGDHSKLYPRGPRFEFKEVCEII